MIENTTHNQVAIIFLGFLGTGKSTQARLLKEQFGFRHISIGNMLRANIEAGTSLGRTVEQYIENGSLIPNDLSNSIIEDELRMLNANGSEASIILDDYPQTIEQADKLDEILLPLHIPIAAVFVLDSKIEDIIERLTGCWMNPRNGRTYHEKFNSPKIAEIDNDDNSRLIQYPNDPKNIMLERFTNYQTQIEPVIKRYLELELVVHINSHESLENVTIDLKKNLNTHLKNIS